MTRKPEGSNHGIELAGAWRFFGLFALNIVLLMLRRPDAITNPQFWAEDGHVFFRDQILYGFWGSLFLPYHGYLCVTQRLVAALASLFPATYAPLILNLFAFIIVALCCSLFALNWYRSIVKSDWLRALLCILMATAFYVDETIGNITNVLWYLLVAALLLMLLPDKAYEQVRPWQRYIPAAACLLIGLTAPLTIVLIPLGIWSAVRRKGPAKLASAAVVVAALLQVCIVVFVPSAGRPVPSGNLYELIVGSLMGVTYRVVLSSMLGHSLAATVPPGVALCILAAVAVWLITLWRGRDALGRRQVAVSVYLILASVALAMSGRALGRVFANPSHLDQVREERYFLLGACLFAFLVACSIERWMPRRNLATQAAVLLVVFAAGIWGNFRIAPLADLEWRVYGPAVDSWRRAVRSGKSVVRLYIPINNPMAFALELPAFNGSGPPLDPLASKWEGHLVRRPGRSPEDGKYFFVENGQKRWITDSALLPATRLKSTGDLTTISAAELSAIPTGSPIVSGSIYEGRLVRRSGPAPEDEKLYIVQNGVKHWVRDVQWAIEKGYRWPEDVLVIPKSDLDAIPLGERIVYKPR
jgi:hypothetical protein